jgi:hypothetical protein
MGVSTVKNKVVTFEAKDIILSKICMYNKVIGQVNCLAKNSDLWE